MQEPQITDDTGSEQHRLETGGEVKTAMHDDITKILHTDPSGTGEIIFVFGSNELGLHGGGAAYIAKRDHGARYDRKGGPGQGFGPQGKSFAIPTCSKPTGEAGFEISFDRMKYYVACFLMYATWHPELQFQVTQIGCGLAGWTKEQIAPLFVSAPENCSFDTDWQPFLGERMPHGATRKYWGHVG
jgi:hypothetical protein